MSGEKGEERNEKRVMSREKGEVRNEQ